MSRSLERRLCDLLGLAARPVALAFTAAPPPGLPRVAAPSPAGCGYWKRAAAGERFHTLASDHFGCAVGAHTHGVPLGPDQQKDLESLVQTMVGLSYLTVADVEAIPTRQQPFGAVSYGPLGELGLPPDVVLVRGSPRVGMLLAEACHAAGVRGGAAVMRPACAMVPQLLATQQAQESHGCIGNRVYTELPDGEGWYALPGAALSEILAKLETAVEANRALESFHRARA